MKKINNKKRHPRNCLDELDQTIINNLILLQNRNREYYGFIKEGKLVDVRRGDPSSVRVELMPEEQACEFHVHPLEVPLAVDLGEYDKKEQEEMECGREANLARISMISPADASIAINYRPKIDLTSLMVSHNQVTQYVLVDTDKFDHFKKEVSELLGDIDADNITTILMNKWEKFYNEAMNEQYDMDQNFSQCADKDIWLNGKRKWYEFLRSIGMEIEEKPIQYQEEK